MTIMIDIPEQQVTVLTAKAKAQGLTLEGWFRRVADNEASLRSTAHFQKTDPEAWILHLEASVARLPKMPVLSDYAMSRESIYSGRS